MSIHVYRIIEKITGKYGRIARTLMLALLLVLGAALVDYVSDSLYAQVPDNLKAWVLLAEKIVILTLFFLMMWYYHKSRILLHDYATHQNQLQLFIKHTPAAVAMLDRDMNYIIVSDRWLTDYSIKEQNIIGRNHYDIFPMIRQNPVWVGDHRRALDLGESTRREEDSFIGLSGKREWLTYEILPWYDGKGRIGGLIFYTEVITPRMEALQKLRESEARFARAMRGSNDGIFDWEVQNDKVYISPRFKRFLGYEETDIENNYEGFIRLIHPEDFPALQQKVEDHLFRREPYHVEYRLRKKTGDYIWIEARGQTEWDNEGRPVYFSGVMVDISERRRLEELRKEFVYVVTHELRTPLSALRGALDMLPHLLGSALPEKAGRSLDLALQGCERLSSLVDDLLTAGRAETDALSVELEKCDAASMLQQAIDLNSNYGQNYGVDFKITGDVPSCELNVDKGRFMQVMANLLSNAAKFSPQGSVVEISSSCDDKNITIAVRDHGPGIPEEFRCKIFQKFARGQSDKPGTGLGLNIARTMVEKMHGRIWFETEQGRGTVFFVQFPVT